MSSTASPFRSVMHVARGPAASDEPAQSAETARLPESCVDSGQLLRGRKTVAISHNGSTYRLQATRLGKLILTK